LLGQGCQIEGSQCNTYFLQNDPDTKKQNLKNEELAYNGINAVVAFWPLALIKAKTR
jgi:hypothetical protein